MLIQRASSFREAPPPERGVDVGPGLGQRLIPVLGQEEGRESGRLAAPAGQVHIADAHRQVEGLTVDLAATASGSSMFDGHVRQGANLGRDMAARPGNLDSGPDQGHALATAPDLAQRRALVVEGFGDDPVELEPLGDGCNATSAAATDGRRFGQAHQHPRQVAVDLGPSLVHSRLGQGGGRGIEDRSRFADLARVDQDLAQQGLGEGGSRSILALLGDRLRLLGQGLRLVVIAAGVRRPGGSAQEGRLGRSDCR